MSKKEAANILYILIVAPIFTLFVLVLLGPYLLYVKARDAKERWNDHHAHARTEART